MDVGKLKEVGQFVTQIGVPSVIVLVLLGLAVGSWFGYFENPLVTKGMFEEYKGRNEQLHAQVKDAVTEHGEQLEDVRKAIRGLRCELRPTPERRAWCFSKLADEDHR